MTPQNMICPDLLRSYYSFIKSQDEEKSKIAKSIISGSDIIISTQIINEMCVNLLKKAKFSEGKIQKLIQSLYKRYTVFELSQDILIKASEIRTEFTFSFWDSIVAASAIAISLCSGDAVSLQAAYGESEPDYFASMVRENNPDYNT